MESRAMFRLYNKYDRLAWRLLAAYQKEVDPARRDRLGRVMMHAIQVCDRWQSKLDAIGFWK